MKKLKKTMTLFLAVILTLAMGVNAFAATQTGKLTVNVNQGNTLKGQTLHLYKLFDLTVSGGDDAKYAYTLNGKYKDLLKDLLFTDDPDADAKTSADYYQAVADLEKAPAVGEKTAIQNFADQFTAVALTESALTADETSGKITAETDNYVFDTLDYGYYLVYQTGTKELQSSLVSVDKDEVEVDLKGQAPTVTKAADKDSVQIGDVITYTIEGVIPDTTGYAGYTYKVHDKLTDGLDFAADENGTAVTGDSYEVSVKIGAEAAETETATLSGSGNRQMELDLSQWIKDNQASKGESFTVTYYAKVNTNAAVETKNSAQLEYGNSADDTTMSTPSEAATPTYPLSIRKTDTGDTVLPDALFRLYENEADAAAANDNAVKVTGQNGIYTVAEDQTAEDNMDMATADSETQGRNLYLNGLAAGTYWLVETQAPDGYNKLAAPVKITIHKDGQNQQEWTVDKDDVNEPDKIIDIENTTGALLPGTGGMGTAVFIVLGAALILIVSISFVRSRRNAS